MCLNEFPNRRRLVNLIRYRSNICRINLLLGPPILSDEEVEALDDAERDSHVEMARKGLRAHHAASPCHRVPGPIPAPLIDLDKFSKHHSLGRGRNYNS